MPETKSVIYSKNAPEAIGPYSQAISTRSALLFISGQVGIDPATKQLVKDDFQNEAKQVLNNIQAILAEAGLTFDDIVKTEIFLTDLSHFTVVNSLYQSYFQGSVFPARQTIQVSALPLGASIEISCIAAMRRCSN